MEETKMNNLTKEVIRQTIREELSSLREALIEGKATRKTHPDDKVLKTFELASKEIREKGAVMSLRNVYLPLGFCLNTAEQRQVKRLLDKEFEFFGNKAIWAWRIGNGNGKEKVTPIRKIRTRKLTNKGHEKVRKMLVQGKNPAEIAKKCNITLQTVYNLTYVMKKAGTTRGESRKRKKFSKTEKAVLVQELKNGAKIEKIAKLLKMDYDRVYKKIWDLKKKGKVKCDLKKICAGKNGRPKRSSTPNLIKVGQDTKMPRKFNY